VIACLVSLGCPKNLVDSEVVLGYLGRNGFSLTTNPETADVVVINTCSFIKPAVDESFKKVKEIIRFKRQGKVKRVVVIGCLVQRFGHKLKKIFPEVDAFLGIDELSEVATPWQTGEIIHYSPNPIRLFNEPRLLSTPSHYAYLKISDGCDNRCSYCLLPQIRGRFRSRSIGDIISEAKDLARIGVKELILVAQDTTRFGFDRYGELRLVQLLKELEAIAGIQWIRLLYTHPAHYTAELIEVLKQIPKVVKCVDLPLQHISDSILKRMNRRYNRKRVEVLLAKLHGIPGMKIRTTFITGFPGETRGDFLELFDFVRLQEFDSLGVFPYSREPGTKAYSFKSQIPDKIKVSRYQQLMEVQKSISLQKQREWVGKELEVLIDGPTTRTGYDLTPLENPDFWSKTGKNRFKHSMREESNPPSEFLTGYIGRAYFDSPEIDGRVYVKGKGLKPGDFVPVRILKALTYDRFGEVMNLTFAEH
jgi:ribosomal protein S12 methylthiotransferase